MLRVTTESPTPDEQLSGCESILQLVDEDLKIRVNLGRVTTIDRLVKILYKIMAS